MVSMRFRHSLNIQLVGKDLKKAERTYLRRAAARVRLRVRSKRFLGKQGGKGESPQPGQPPLTKSKKSTNLRESVAYKVDYNLGIAYVQLRKYSGSVRDVPKVLEFGGTTVGGRVVTRKVEKGRDQAGRFKQTKSKIQTFFADRFTYRPRPYLRPALEDVRSRGEFEKIYIDTVRRVFSRR